MWCPEGYVTLEQVRSSALMILRDFICFQYLDPKEIEVDEHRKVPEDAWDLIGASANWLIQEWLSRDGWGISTPDGDFVQVRMRPLLDVYDWSLDDAGYYNPITTIGPPSPKWLSLRDHRYFDRFLLLDFNSGLIRAVTFPWKYWHSAMLSKLFWNFGITSVPNQHIMRAFVWRNSLKLAWKLRGRAVCLKASILEGWANETVDYLNAFMGNSGKEDDTGHSVPGQGDSDQPIKSTPGRKPKEREEIAAARFDLYGPIREPIVSYKETARVISTHIGETVHWSTLRRAFDALRED